MKRYVLAVCALVLCSAPFAVAETFQQCVARTIREYQAEEQKQLAELPPGMRELMTSDPDARKTMELVNRTNAETMCEGSRSSARPSNPSAGGDSEPRVRGFGIGRPRAKPAPQPDQSVPTPTTEWRPKRVPIPFDGAGTTYLVDTVSGESYAWVKVIWMDRISVGGPKGAQKVELRVVIQNTSGCVLTTDASINVAGDQFAMVVARQDWFGLTNLHTPGPGRRDGNTGSYILTKPRANTLELVMEDDAALSQCRTVSP